MEPIRRTDRCEPGLSQLYGTAFLVEEAIERLLEYEASFIAAVEQGRAAVRRGDLVDHDEVIEHIEQIFRS